MGSPSDRVNDPAAIKETVDCPSGPRYGRPSHRFGPPTALFNRELAILRYDLDHLEGLTPDLATVEGAFNLALHSAVFYADEKGRESRLQEFLREVLPGWSKWQQSVADGIRFEGVFAYLILELTNEQGLGGEPFLQSSVVYCKVVNQWQVPSPLPLSDPSINLPQQYAEFILRSNLPIILLSLAGNRLEVSTAIFTNAVCADKLLSIDLLLGPHAQDKVQRVARAPTAISKRMEGLRKLYRNLAASPDRVPWAEFPSPTPDPPVPPPENFPVLKLFCKLDYVHGTGLVTVYGDNERHALYLARRSTGIVGDQETVLVKFTPKYNKAAHPLPSEHSPPRPGSILVHTRHRRYPDGCYGILSDAKPLYHFLTQSPCLPPPSVQAVRRDLAAALKVLHEKNFGFGELREANVLYSPEAGGRAFLVDFDGVGEHGMDSSALLVLTSSSVLACPGGRPWRSRTMN